MKEEKEYLHYVLNNKPAVHCNKHNNAKVEQARVALPIIYMKKKSQSRHMGHKIEYGNEQCVSFSFIPALMAKRHQEESTHKKYCRVIIP